MIEYERRHGSKHGEKPKEIVKELVSQQIKQSLKESRLNSIGKIRRSAININGDSLNQAIEYLQTIDFTSFAHGVLEAYKETHGDLEVVSISFRKNLREQ
ncbi:MAG: hypothetical protein QW213_06855 [Thermoproteota archaeon]